MLRKATPVRSPTRADREQYEEFARANMLLTKKNLARIKDGPDRVKEGQLELAAANQRWDETRAFAKEKGISDDDQRDMREKIARDLFQGGEFPSGNSDETE